MRKKLHKRKLTKEEELNEDNVTLKQHNDDQEEDSDLNFMNTINEDNDEDSSDNDENDKDDDKNNEFDEVLFDSGDDNYVQGESDDLKDDEDSEGDGDQSVEEEDIDSVEDESEEEEGDANSEEEEDDDTEDEEDENDLDINIKRRPSEEEEQVALKPKLVKKKSNETNDVTTKTEEYTEKDGDTSDEEDIRNTVGNVPKNWYDEYKHLGYDWDGKQIIKPKEGDRIDEFLKRVEDPNFWRTVKDLQTGQDVVLTEHDIDLIKRINQQRLPNVNFDDYAPWIEWFTKEVMVMPIRKFPEHKRSFLPSKTEAKKVSKLVHALKMGWIKTLEEDERDRKRKQLENETERKFYLLWSTNDDEEDSETRIRRIAKHIPAPKRHLPTHAESYNPPSEYLFDAKEMKQWDKLKETPWKRKLHYLPQKYDALRKVPAYSRYIKERFLRCLDLYLCPRDIKMKLTIDPIDLVPKLPRPTDLQPFPSVNCIEYVGHKDMIRTISLDYYGQYLLTGSDDQTVKVWEVNTGRCLKTYAMNGIVKCVRWCPNKAISLIMVAVENCLYLINPGVGDLLLAKKTDQLFASVTADAVNEETIVSERVKSTVKWEIFDSESTDYVTDSRRFALKHFQSIDYVDWHAKGDYFVSVMSSCVGNRSVLISQLSKRRSQLPFNKMKGLIQCVKFHPIKPFLFVCTQRHVRIYDLIKQELIKKLYTNSKWISSIDVHPLGDNVLIGTYDKKLLWYDLDLSTKPYRTLRLHGAAIRGVAYHKRYPLFASSSDDKSVIVSHGMVYNDLLMNPLIVPLKRLQDHQTYNDFGCFDVLFHPMQPWLFTSGADGKVILYCN